MCFHLRMDIKIIENVRKKEDMKVRRLEENVPKARMVSAMNCCYSLPQHNEWRKRCKCSSSSLERKDMYFATARGIWVPRRDGQSRMLVEKEHHDMAR